MKEHVKHFTTYIDEMNEGIEGGTCKVADHAVIKQNMNVDSYADDTRLMDRLNDEQSYSTWNSM